MALDERAFFTERPESRTGRYPVPEMPADQRLCHPLGEALEKGPPARRRRRADRQKFSKVRDHLLRLDDEVTCTTCGKKFEIPSQHSLVFVDQFAGLPNDEELEREIELASGEPAAAAESKPALPARFTRKPTGWK